MRALGIVMALGLPLACGGDECPAGTVEVDGRCELADLDGGPCDATWYRDADEDGWGDDGDIVCKETDGYVERGCDCADDDRDVNPGVDDVCNGIDDDCDDVPDQDFSCVLGASSDCTTACGTTGSSLCGDGCVPGACEPPEEECNNEDDDCDGFVDEDLYRLEAPVAVGGGVVGEDAPSIAWAGGAFFVAWGDEGGDNPNVRYATIEDDVVSPPGGAFLAPAAGAGLRWPRLAGLGSDVALVFNDENGPGSGRGSAVACVLDPADPNPEHCISVNDALLDVYSSMDAPAGIAASADTVGIGFINDTFRGLPYDATFGRVDAVPEERGDEIVIGEAASGTTPVAVAYDATQDTFLIAWLSDREIRIGQVDSNGVEQGSDAPIAVPNDGFEELFAPSVAWGDGSGLVAYVRAESAALGVPMELEVQVVNEDGDPSGEPIRLGTAGLFAPTDTVDIRWTGSGYVIAFVESGGVAMIPHAAYVVRVAMDGHIREDPVRLNPGESQVKSGALVWTGTEVGVVWVDDSRDGDFRVWFARYTCR